MLQIRSGVVSAVVCTFLVVMAAQTAAQDKAPRKFFSGYTGKLPATDADKARTYFQKPAVRALLAQLEHGNMTKDEVETALAESGISVPDLLHVRILRQADDRFSIGFAYFTATDMQKIYSVADRVAPSLASAYRQRQQELQRVFDEYPVRTVPKKQIAFVLLAGFCLNWDGLSVTDELGYRRPVLVEGKDFRYSFWASEEVGGRDYHEFYWGSSTYPLAGDGADPAAYSFSSFGDPDSDPRMNLPDLLFLSAKDLAPVVRAAAQEVGLHDTDELGQHFQGVLGGDRLGPISRILFALRQRPRSAAELKPLAGRSPESLLKLLQQIDYVERDGRGRYHLVVPVFDDQDRPMVGQTIALSRGIMKMWLQQHYPEMKRELANLTAVRAGLPFEAVFTQIWHEIFGLVTRDLTRSGAIASAYAPAVRHQGSFSVLWRQSLYRFIPG